MSPYQNNILPLTSWSPSGNDPLIISGPCGAESEEQLMSTARAIKEIGKVHLFRTGIWKPRTRPDSFEGVGVKGLPWLQKVRSELNLPVCIEVANASHVEQALKHDIDVLWVGARTTVNPFSVQEIADALKGVDIPVMVKNPVHPDIGLWIGAVERFLKSGQKKVLAIHRGFHTDLKTRFRNNPLWEIPIELKVLMPELPIICDPSHICGRKDTIQEVAQKALDLGMNGLMIESHINPTQALSDAEQQLTPAALNQILSQLNFRNQSIDDSKFNNELLQLRNIIDELDSELISVLKKRSGIIERIGEYKKLNHVTIFQLERWKEILRTRTEWSNKEGFPSDFTEKFCQLLHEESIRIQNEIMNK